MGRVGWVILKNIKDILYILEITQPLYPLTALWTKSGGFNLSWPSCISSFHFTMVSPPEIMTLVHKVNHLQQAISCPFRGLLGILWNFRENSLTALLLVTSSNVARRADVILQLWSDTVRRAAEVEWSLATGEAGVETHSVCITAKYRNNSPAYQHRRYSH